MHKRSPITLHQAMLISVLSIPFEVLCSPVSKITQGKYIANKGVYFIQPVLHAVVSYVQIPTEIKECFAIS